MDRYDNLDYLRRKLVQKSVRVNTRYRYYEMKNFTRDLGISSPPSLKNWQTSLGWCAKAVDSLADRLVFRQFDKDYLNFNAIFNMNNPDIFFDSAILSALISSCCFVYISADSDGYPRLQVIDGANATGIMDPITGLLKEGYAVLEREDSSGSPLTEAYFTPEETIIIRKGDNIPESWKNNTGYPLLVPIVYRPDAKREFGHSRITRAAMSYAGSAIRTIKRSEIAAEYFSFPQRWATGVSDDVEEIDKWRASMSTLLTFTKDEDGDSPTLGSFTQQSMAPHTEQLRTFAALFAGEVGLTLDDLGFATENPSSAEAIKSSHETLRLTAGKAQRTFGSGFRNVGLVAACLRDDYQYLRRQIRETTPLWEPIFEPDMSTLSLIGDGALKINQAIPGYFDAKNLRNLTGIDAGANAGTAVGAVNG